MAFAAPQRVPSFTKTTTGSGAVGAAAATSSTPRDVRVRVIVRVRPMLEHELQDGAGPCVTVCDIGTLELDRESQAFQYKFDSCYDESVTQTDLYRNEIKDLVLCPLKGQNASCFAYGPTGAGKTHTMQGTVADPGIIPRVVKQLFKEIERETFSGEWQHQVTVSYMEIYNEKVYDLLEFQESDLPIREDAAHNIFIPGLTEKQLKNYEDFADSFSAALSNRSTAPTKLNARSSRSHAVMLIKVTKTQIKAPFAQLLGKIHLVDLAGSEDNRRADNAGQRLKESGAINRSLFVLNQVVEALNRGDARIPYRDSKLTRLLQDSLGGDSHSCMVANISPCAMHFADTYNCLNFASKSRRIVNHTTTTSRVPAPPPLPAAVALATSSSTSSSNTLSSTATQGRKPLIEGPPLRVKAADGTSALSKTTSAAALASTQTAASSALSAGLKDKKGVAVLPTKGKAEKEVKMRTASFSHAPPKVHEAAATSRPSSFCESNPGSQTNSARDSGVHDSLAAMTPGSKTTFAKACIMKAKLFHKMGRLAEALAMYEEAQGLFPDSGKLEERIADVRAELKKSGTSEGAAAPTATIPAGAGAGVASSTTTLAAAGKIAPGDGKGAGALNAAAAPKEKKTGGIARRVLAAINAAATDGAEEMDAEEGAGAGQGKAKGKGGKRTKKASMEETGGAEHLDGEEAGEVDGGKKSKKRAAVGKKKAFKTEEVPMVDGDSSDEESASPAVVARKRHRSSVVDPEWMPVVEAERDADHEEDEADSTGAGRGHHAPARKTAAQDEEMDADEHAGDSGMGLGLGVDAQQTKGPSVSLNASLGIRLERDLLQVLNTGGMKELMKINGVGKKRALNIMAFREQERPLEQLTDLYLCGFGKKLVDSLVKGNLVINFR